MRGLAACTLLVLLCAAAPVEAQRPDLGSVWTVFTTVQASVQENYATVKIVTDISNRGPDPEFPFVVRIPDDAFVTGLIIERDGTVYEAQVKDRSTARQEYETWKAQEQTGGLVEKARHTSVYSYLINVAEFTNVRATLTYDRYLAADRGVYNLSLEAPVSGFGQDLGARFEFDVQDSDGVTLLWGDPAGRVEGERLTYDVGPRSDIEHPTPFTASYTLAPTADAGSLLTTIVDGKGYFAHRVRALESARQLPMDLVLVLDVSGSMAGLKLQQMIDAAKQVVRSLGDEDTLHLVAFSSDAQSPWNGMRSMTRADRLSAAREIDALFDGGGTNIGAGLTRGFNAIAALDWGHEEGRFPALVLLTDGQPTSGTMGRDPLLALQRRANEHDIPVFGIAFGEDADWGLIRALAQDAEGAAIRVPVGHGAEVDLRRFMSALTTPVLRDVEITYGPGVEAFRQGAPVLFAGSELLVVGTFDPALGISGTIAGRSIQGQRLSSFDGGAPGSLAFLPKLVAYHRVRALQEEDVPDVAQIKELALTYSFVTDHTSLVLTLPARDPQQAWVSDQRCDECGTVASSPSGTPPAADMYAHGGTTPTSAPSASGVTGLNTGGASPVPSNGNDPSAGEHSPRVPGPGSALIALAIAGVALMLRRR